MSLGVVAIVPMNPLARLEDFRLRSEISPEVQNGEHQQLSSQDGCGIGGATQVTPSRLDYGGTTDAARVPAREMAAPSDDWGGDLFVDRHSQLGRLL